jgi:hypothetical protein
MSAKSAPTSSADPTVAAPAKSAASTPTTNAREPVHTYEKDRRGDNSVATSAGTTEPTAEKMSGDFWALDFGVHKSLRYHAKRRLLFDTLHRWSLAAVAIGGSAAFFALTGAETRIAKVTTLIVAIAATLDVAFDFAAKAREHDRFYERFSELASKLALLDPERLDANLIREYQAERLLLEKGEPSALDALNVICHNEEAEARGYDKDQRCEVGWFQKLVAQFVTVPWFSPTPLK